MSGIDDSAFSKEQADAESNARLVEALFGSVEEREKKVERDRDTPSHQQLDLDEDGNPVQLRFVYVDETNCIGCTFCATVARNTFYMNDDAGRARVFDQGGDDPEVVQEAIDTCPVCCISYVDHEDLVILETEREGIVINPMSMGIPATWSARMNGAPPTKAKMGRMGGGASLTTCTNCPSRGCKECPMYGVGMNPVYIERMEARKAKRERNGQAAAERQEAAKAKSVDTLFEVGSAAKQEDADAIAGVVVPVGLELDAALDAAAPSTDFFEALYGTPALDDESANVDGELQVPIGFGGATTAFLDAAAQKQLEAEQEELRRMKAERAAAETAKAEAAAREAEELARAEAVRMERSEAQSVLSAMLATDAPLTQFGLPSLVETKIKGLRAKGSDLTKGVSAFQLEMARKAMDAKIEALVQATERAEAAECDAELILQANERRIALADERRIFGPDA